MGIVSLVEMSLVASIQPGDDRVFLIILIYLKLLGSVFLLGLAVEVVCSA